MDYVIGLVNGMSTFAETHLVVSESDEWCRECLVREVKVFRSGAPRVGNLFNLASLLNVARYISREKPDIVHLQSGVVWELALVKMFRRIPFIITVHDITKHPVGKLSAPSSPQRFIDYGARNSAGIIVHGDVLLKTAIDRYPRDKTITSLDHGLITRYGSGLASADPRNFGVLLFGNVNAWKGIEYLVRSEPLVREAIPQAKFIIAGHTMEQDYYRSLVQPGQNIEMRLSRQSDDDVRALFQWADVLVLPYIEASQSGVLQLGFSFGLPAVVTGVGGLPDVVTHEKNGIVVPPKDPGALAQAIIRLLRDTTMRQEIIKRIAFERETRFNWTHIARQTVDFYRQVIDVRTSRHKHGAAQ